MSRMLISMAVLATLTMAARAQAPAPAAPANPPTTAEATPPDGGKAKAAGGDTANDQTYKMKDGGMYQPPAQRPSSPAQDRGIYGRT